VSLSPYDVVDRLQLYRVVTSALFHKGFAHLLFNCLAFGTIGSPIERKNGSLFLFWFLWTAIVFSSSIYIGMSYGLYAVTSSSEWIRVRCVGLSGVIFALAVVDGFREAESTEDTHRRALCGLVRVPRKVYPFVLLIILQIMLPEVSFLGHLSGLLYGLLFVHGKMKCVFLSTSKMRELETRIPSVFTRESIVLTPAINREDVMAYSNFRDTYVEWLIPVFTQIRTGFSNIVTWIRRHLTSGQEYERVSTVDSFDHEVGLEEDPIVAGKKEKDNDTASRREEARLKRLEYLEKKKKNPTSTG